MHVQIITRVKGRRSIRGTGNVGNREVTKVIPGFFVVGRPHVNAEWLRGLDKTNAPS